MTPDLLQFSIGRGTETEQSLPICFLTLNLKLTLKFSLFNHSVVGGRTSYLLPQAVPGPVYVTLKLFNHTGYDHSELIFLSQSNIAFIAIPILPIWQ